MALGQPKGTNPFMNKPIPKGRIQWALNNSVSIKGAARILGVSYNTFKKYAKQHDLFEQYKNVGGAGIPKASAEHFRVKLKDIFDGKHPTYRHWKLQELLIRSGHFVNRCTNCGYEEVRDVDSRGPYLIDFMDGDGRNHSPDNLRLLCYNCFFLIKPVGKHYKTPKDVMQIRRNMWKVFKEEKTVREKLIEENYDDSIPPPTMEHKKEESPHDTTVNPEDFGDLSDVNISLDDLFKDDD